MARPSHQLKGRPLMRGRKHGRHDRQQFFPSLSCASWLAMAPALDCPEQCGWLGQGPFVLVSLPVSTPREGTYTGPCFLVV